MRRSEEGGSRSAQLRGWGGEMEEQEGGLRSAQLREGGEMEEQDVRECRRMALCQQQQGRSRKKSEVGSLPLQEGEDFGLPHHIFLRILAFLPVLQLFRSRLVCKSWNSLLQSPAFLEARFAEEAASTDHDDPWLVMERKVPCGCAKEFVAYCTSLETWFPFPFQSPSISSALGHCSVCVASADLLESFCENGPHICAPYPAFHIVGAGGLVCCCVMDRLPHVPSFLYGYTVLVCNPLTGGLKRLPPHPKHHPLFKVRYSFDDTVDFSISMVANNPTASDSYHVALHDTGWYDPSEIYDSRSSKVVHYYPMEIYDSRRSSWKIGQPIAAAKFIGDVLNADLFSYDCQQGLLFAYTAELNEWSKITVHCPLPCPTVLKCKGRLLFVSSIESDEIIESFEVWELQTSSYADASCIKVAETPPDNCQGYHQYDADIMRTEVKFITNGTLICMTGTRMYQKEVFDGGYWLRPLVYDLVLGCWYHLPDYMGSLNFLGLFSFRPRLTATICLEGN